MATRAPSVLIDLPADQLGRYNAIIASTQAKHVDGVAGALSVKWMPVGWAVWRTSSATYRVEGARYLVLNHGQVYSLARESGEPQESFCPFFAVGFVEEAHRTLVTREADLIDDGDSVPGLATEFNEQIYEDDGRVVPQLGRMRAAVNDGGASQEWLEQEMHALAEQLVRTRTGVRRAIAMLPARRESTRAELHQRLQRGREYMHAHFTRPLPLVEIARAACLSSHYFHRLFRAAFRRTPHAYLTDLRLERAASLLRRTDMPVTDICAAVGFESLGSFSHLFRRHMGCSPTQFNFARFEKRGAAAVR